MENNIAHKHSLKALFDGNEGALQFQKLNALIILSSDGHRLWKIFEDHLQTLLRFDDRAPLICL